MLTTGDLGTRHDDVVDRISVRLRFVLTRLWFALSIGSGAGMGDPKAVAWLRAVVVDVQPVVAHEIWSVTVEHDLGLERRRETIYVLEATCEGMKAEVARVAAAEAGAMDEKRMHLVRSRAAELRLVRHLGSLRDPKVEFKAQKM